ncbi:MAG: hypothetical protein AB8B85_04090 [Paracoccaceae bacterium]
MPEADTQDEQEPAPHALIFVRNLMGRADRYVGSPDPRAETDTPFMQQRLHTGMVQSLIFGAFKIFGDDARDAQADDPNEIGINQLVRLAQEAKAAAELTDPAAADIIEQLIEAAFASALAAVHTAATRPEEEANDV